MKLPKALLIFGCGGHSVAVTDTAESLGLSEITFIDPLASALESMHLGRAVFNQVPSQFRGGFHVAIGENFLRERVTREIQKLHPRLIPITLIHPSSVVSKRATIGAGTLIMPLCVVNGNSVIGDGVILNTRSSVEHDSRLMNFASLAPAVSLGGRVQIGERSAMSIGAIVKHGIEIGNDSVIGAGSLVLKSLPSNIIAFGNPAKIIRERPLDEPYL